MNHPRKVGLVILVLFNTSFVSPDSKADPGFDSFLEAYTTAWNTHDSDALAAMFTDDADLIMGNLPRIDGKEAIGRWWNTYFSRIDEDRKGEFKLLSLRNIAPDVQIVNVSSKTFSSNKQGKELETRLARGTWVLVKTNNSWLIAAMRGMPAMGEQRLSPGTDR
jgi:uncharacterized protein (TIGR02246 family)